MKTDMSKLLEGLANEMGDEAKNTLSPEEMKLHEVAQRLLRLERDLKVPGVAQTSAVRVDRILDALAKENF